MPVISFVSPKGGVGKTTSAAILACELADASAAVTAIDADPNQPLTTWAAIPGKPENINVIGNITEDQVIDTIETAATKTPFVVVDLEGTASMTVSYAISRSDLILIPIQGSQLDAEQAAKAIKLVRQTEKAFNTKIDHALLFTRTSVAIQPRTLRHVQSEFEKYGISILSTQMIEREAFRAIFSFGGSLKTLDRAKVSNLETARANARAFAKEVTDRMKTRKAA